MSLVVVQGHLFDISGFAKWCIENDKLADFFKMIRPKYANEVPSFVDADGRPTLFDYVKDTGFFEWYGLNTKIDEFKVFDVDTTCDKVICAIGTRQAKYPIKSVKHDSTIDVTFTGLQDIVRTKFPEKGQTFVTDKGTFVLDYKVMKTGPCSPTLSALPDPWKAFVFESGTFIFPIDKYIVPSKGGIN
jgi:hypothetical protein